MHSDPALAALRDIAHHIELATGFVAGMSFGAFRDDLPVAGRSEDPPSRDRLA